MKTTTTTDPKTAALDAFHALTDSAKLVRQATDTLRQTSAGFADGIYEFIIDGHTATLKWNNEEFAAQLKISDRQLRTFRNLGCVRQHCDTEGLTLPETGEAGDTLLGGWKNAEGKSVRWQNVGDNEGFMACLRLFSEYMDSGFYTVEDEAAKAAKAAVQMQAANPGMSLGEAADMVEDTAKQSTTPAQKLVTMTASMESLLGKIEDVAERKAVIDDIRKMLTRASKA